MKFARLMVACLCLAAAGSPRAQEVSAEKRAEIERLLELTGALAMGQQMAGFFVTQLGQMIRQQNPNVPSHVIDALPEEVNAVIKEQLPLFKEMVIPLYSKYFTLEELLGLRNFYSSPLGRKTVAAMPSLMQESMALGSQWGQALGPRINERLRMHFRKESIKI